MKAKVINVEKSVMPRYDNSANADIPTIVLVATVEFYTDDGQLQHTQVYSCLPEDYPSDDYQSQADVMQADLDHAKVQQAIDAQGKLADDKVEAIKARNNIQQS
jgi:hypothetical protein